MNQKQALAKLRKALGPRFAYRTNSKALSADEREAASEQAKALLAQMKAAEDAMVARREELLRDPAYLEMKAEFQRLRKEREEVCGKARAKPITVGTADSMFFSVMAEGDNWAEVVAQVEKGKA